MATTKAPEQPKVETPAETPAEKQKVLGVQLTEGLHHDLKVLAAVKSTTVKDLVSTAVKALVDANRALIPTVK